MHAFFEDQDFQFSVENVLGSAYSRAADVGEVLSTVDRIPNGAADAWVTQWTATADRVADEARAAEAAGHPRTAAARWLRASSYDWTRAIADALTRGWNAMTYDGPGQNAALVRQGLPFRPDWENVLTPVVDTLTTRPDVDPGRIAVMGISQGGYWVPRAAAFEHRIAAAVADPGVVDVSTTTLGQLPHFLVKLLDAGDRDKFDSDTSWALEVSPATRRMLAWRMRPYGVTSPAAAVHRGRGRGLALRADGGGGPRRAGPRLARRAGPGLSAWRRRRRHGRHGHQGQFGCVQAGLVPSAHGVLPSSPSMTRGTRRGRLRHPTLTGGPGRADGAAAGTGLGE